MNKVIPLIFMVTLSLVACSERPVIERIHGTWRFDRKATWEFKHPGTKYDKEEDGAASFIGDTVIAIDTKKQVFSIKFDRKFEKTDAIQSYIVISEDKYKVNLKLDDTIESFEIRKNGTLLLCPPIGSMQKCMAYMKKSSNPKDIGALKIEAPKRPRPASPSGSSPPIGKKPAQPLLPVLHS